MSQNRVVITRSQRLGFVGLTVADLVAAVVLLNFSGGLGIADAAAGGDRERLPDTKFEFFGGGSAGSADGRITEVFAGQLFISGFLTYIAYGLGMSALLMAVTLAVALAKQQLVRGLRSMLRHVQKVSAGFLIITASTSPGSGSTTCRPTPASRGRRPASPRAGRHPSRPGSRPIRLPSASLPSGLWPSPHCGSCSSDSKNRPHRRRKTTTTERHCSIKPVPRPTVRKNR